MERTHNYVCKRKTAGKEKARRSLGSMNLWTFKNLNLMKVRLFSINSRANIIDVNFIDVNFDENI